MFYVQADSFPNGVKAAFDKLQEHTGGDNFNELFGISYMGRDGKIIYKAAAPETFEGEAAKKGLSTFTIRKGTYHCHTIHDWQQHMDQFGNVFQQLLQHPDLDPEGACIEWYHGTEAVLCMVPLRESAHEV